MTSPLDAEKAIIEVSEELLRFRSASQQLELTHEAMAALRDRLVELAQKSASLLDSVSASFNAYSTELEKQMDELIAEARAVDLAEFRTVVEKTLGELSELMKQETSAIRQDYKGLQESVEAGISGLTRMTEALSKQVDEIIEKQASHSKLQFATLSLAALAAMLSLVVLLL
jgi:predicted house-cleaning noncanonical NTP pyrophosphatase (MazG superfamily)